MADITIIIVSWNAREYLLRCLKSLECGLGELEAEVIVVDNASTDGSAEAVRELYPEVKLLVQKENLGFARANNIGIRQSTGKYVCLVNSDVIVLEGCMERLFFFMEETPLVALAGPLVFNPDMTLQRTCRSFPSLKSALCSAIGLDGWNYPPHDAIRKVEAISGCFMMARKEVMDEVGLLDERFFFYAEDMDWCKRFHNAGWETVFYPEARAIHYGGSSSALAPVRFYVEMQKANLKYWKKHSGPLKRSAYLSIVFLHQALRIARSAIQFTLDPSGREAAAHKAKRSAACLKWLFTRARTA
ncbi:MAG: hypothetical protein A3I81_06695 [Deltaproteobacteria bacterium RIFCSPLOWO2_02_FULL_55_12]|nr:MAG: hypothetical protein A3I81_06695 [Deltaproteobacteria bacterium RIFCSPLOWO2_02_FULL_55_12]